MAHELRQKMMAAFKISATQRMCMWAEGSMQQVAQRALLRWRANRAEDLGLQMASEYKQMLEMMDSARLELARSQTVASEREVLRVRLSMMEDEFHALNGSAAWVAHNHQKLDLLLQELPRLEARLTQMQQYREVLGAELQPVLARVSADLPQLSKLQHVADETKVISASVHEKCALLEAVHMQGAADAKQCVQELEKAMIHERQRGDTKDAELRHRTPVAEISVLKAEVKHLGDMLQKVTGENERLKQLAKPDSNVNSTVHGLRSSMLGGNSPLGHQHSSPEEKGKLGKIMRALIKK